ncbi:membrane-spanning 4-domains subfamily A member 12 [Grammomys surdaster]|uniref:membrane-spanning 4-domains subfamily A member 12 n=1 Tax=Grammomys surdaster TaxID=491861 RepID=UPI00109F539C|nr:membrane-spanning 4-domains subfamily A member 12 [Grammomys surdaster]
MTSSQTIYPGMRGTIPNPYPPTSSMALHPQQPLGFLNVRNQVQTGQVSFITSPGIFPNNQLGRDVPTVNPAPGAATSNVKDAAIALGVIQITIGLMHIGFGVVLGLLSTSYYMSWAFSSIAFVGGYPFWGGVFVSRLLEHLSLCRMDVPSLFTARDIPRRKQGTCHSQICLCLQFIASGSLSISAFKKFSHCLVKSTLITNIFSTVSSFVGVILFLFDLNINGHHYQNYWMVLSGRGIAGVLAIFSLLEFSIAWATVYFAYQTILYGKRSVPDAPNVYTANPLMQESSPASPIYDNIPDYAPRQ